MTDCPRVGKLFGGCRFVARYDTKPPTPELVKIIPTFTLASFLNEALRAMSTHDYLRDVCTTCGKTIEKAK